VRALRAGGSTGVWHGMCVSATSDGGGPAVPPALTMAAAAGTPPLPDECSDTGLRYFPGSIWDFVVAFLCYTMVLPFFLSCIIAVVGDNSGVGRLVRFVNVAAAIYFPFWGVMM
jgi:hypothetical protein